MIRINPSSVLSAFDRLSSVVSKTPVLTSRTLDSRLGVKVYFKCENFQRVGAFKFRGAYNAISQLSDAEKKVGVITHSSGNHAQGVALACRICGVEAVVVMPFDAPIIKQEATKAYGAEIVHCKAAEREKVTLNLIKKYGYTLIHPFDNDDIISGQGTAALELFQEVGELDALFVPVGGGGLISGSALAAAAISPDCWIVGVEPESADDANRSWRQNHIVVLEAVPDTVADGLRPRSIGQRNLNIMRRYVNDMTTVSEESILESLNFLLHRLKVVVEPSAAVALAPLLSKTYQPPGKRIGVLLSGGNIDLNSLTHFSSTG